MKWVKKVGGDGKGKRRKFRDRTFVEKNGKVNEMSAVRKTHYA